MELVKLMFKHLMLLAVISLLSVAFWLSADFKTIAAGISIFLFGMLALQQGFKFFTGGVLEEVLKASTDNLLKRLSFGIICTMMMQSSSLLSVLVISFISAGLLELASGIGIIFGANLGTTTGAWLVAGFGIKVKISAYAMPLLVFGVLLILNKSKNLQGLGYILAGIGFLFLGIHYMKEGFETFKNTIDLTEYAMTGIQGLLAFVFLGVMATIIIQSSDATMVLIITALSAQQITYDNALALAIGANIGTTVTAILGSLSADIRGKRLAGAHFLFNVSSALLALVLFDQFVWLVDCFTAWVNIAEDDYALKLAAFHSLFNLVGLAVMLPLSGHIARLLETVMEEKRAGADKPYFLNESAIRYPETLVEAVHKETEHLYDNAVHIILKAIGLHRRDVYSDKDLKIVLAKNKRLNEYDIDEAYEHSIKGIYSAIIEFISQADFTWELKQSSRLHWLRDANLKLVEAVKAVKHFQKNLLKSNRSTNQYLKSEYDHICYQIAELIRQLELIKKRQYQTSALPLLSMDALKARLKEQRQNRIEEIEQLIRERKISAVMGTSLLNDNSYVYAIQANLLAMAETVFVNEKGETVEAERQLALTENELMEVVNPNGGENE